MTDDLFDWLQVLSLIITLLIALIELLKSSSSP